jgi:uroporphyrin-III C-methyltransferase/precorrin-2 dehydrogenase/sirohydrochlorin ferrochelatase
MDYFPIFLKLQDAACLVVGGGDVALRKVRLLKAAGARLTVLAPEVTAELAQMIERASCSGCRSGLLMRGCGMRLVVAATNQRAVNQQVSAAAQAQNIPVNVVDDPELSTYITPAIIDRSPLVIAVSSGGACRCWPAWYGRGWKASFRPVSACWLLFRHASATG